jgi:hypothetical protein
MRFATRGQYLAGVAIAVLSASAASSEVFPPVTIGGVYQQMTGTLSGSPPANTGCTSSEVCYAVFERAPLGKQLVVTYASCRLRVTQEVGGSPGNLAAAVLLSQLPNGSIQQREQQVQFVRSDGANFVVSGTTLFALAARQRPLIAVVAGSGPLPFVLGTCDIAGQISDAP